MSTQVRAAVHVIAWTLAYYRRHVVLITALSSVPAAQRFATQLWGDDLPRPVGAASEAVTAGARLLLVYLVIRMAILAEPPPPGGRGRSARAFLRRHWPSLLVQWGLLLLATVVFDVVPEQVLPRWIPADAEAVYFAVLLAIKNLTVIPFTMVWLVGAVRQVVTYGAGDPEHDSGAPPVLAARR